jgi:hypothetical protein
MTQTNGHPIKPPLPSPRPEPTRVLVIEVRDGDVVLDTREPTVAEVAAWLAARGDSDRAISGLYGGPLPDRDPRLTYADELQQEFAEVGPTIDEDEEDHACPEPTSAGETERPGPGVADVEELYGAARRLAEGKLPSERLHEIALKRTGQSESGNWQYTLTIGDVVSYLEERLGRG